MWGYFDRVMWFTACGIIGMHLQTPADHMEKDILEPHTPEHKTITAAQRAAFSAKPKGRRASYLKTGMVLRGVKCCVSAFLLGASCWKYD